jgi:sec-independent protein translocase protein TatA
MGTFSLSHWLVVLVIVLVLFGAGRIPSAMGDVARGIRAFRTGMKDDKAAEPGGETLVEARPADQQQRLTRALLAAARTGSTAGGSTRPYMACGCRSVGCERASTLHHGSAQEAAPRAGGVSGTSACAGTHGRTEMTP